jgi:hypothetical protein
MNTMLHNQETCSFLTNLPLEIRKHIYSYIILDSDTVTYIEELGYLATPPLCREGWDRQRDFRWTLRNHPPQWGKLRVDRSIAQTYKQIYRECKEYFWENVTLLIQFPLPTRFVRKALFWPLLKSIRLRFSYGEDSQGSLKGFLPVVARLIACGRLRRIKLTLDGLRTLSGFGKLVDSQEKLGSMQDLLSFIRKIGHNEAIERSLYINLSQQVSSLVARKTWFDAHSVQRCERALASLHEALSGTIALNEVVCYRGGRQVHGLYEELRDEMEVEHQEMARVDEDYARRVRELSDNMNMLDA